jgi:hypothetical protein
MIDHKYHRTKVTVNRKTGPVTTTTTGRTSCSDACILKATVEEDGSITSNGCYAEQYPMKYHWDKVDSGERGHSLDEFIQLLTSLPYGQLVRHNQAGDLPGDGKFTLYRDDCFKLAKAFRRVNAFTYTSYPLTPFNVDTVKEMIQLGFVVNKSCFSLKHVDEAMDAGLPATVVLPSSTKERKLLTPKGRVVARCPAELSKDISCSNCGGGKGPLCLRKDRDFAVGFVAHGGQKKKTDEALAAFGGE